ncbi:hypothetical protein [Rhodoferax sp. TS-BS-61-7]|nr:hypothetical protein [Rhodoferax sp. TS-BS-61-7]
MNEFPICPLCGQPVNTNTDAHVTEADGVTVKHHECPQPEAEPPAAE